MVNSILLSICFSLFNFTLSCQINNPVYSLVLADDVYYEVSRFEREHNPFLMARGERAHFFDVIDEPDKCFITFIKTIKDNDPKINLYSFHDPAKVREKGYIYSFRGTTLNFNDIFNDLQLAFYQVTNYAKIIKDDIQAHMTEYEHNNVFFVGHSLGGEIAHSIGYLLNVPSTGVDAPGMVDFAPKLKDLYGLDRTYEDYHFRKAVDIVGVPNVVNYHFNRIEKRPIVIFVDVDVPCRFFSSFSFFAQPPLDKIIYDPSWTYNFHNGNDIIKLLIDNRGKVDRVFVRNIDYNLYNVFSHQKAAKIVKKIYDCLPGGLFGKRSFLEFSLDFLKGLKGK